MTNTVSLLEFIRLSNDCTLKEYWNFCFAEFSKLNKFMHVRQFFTHMFNAC